MGSLNRLTDIIQPLNSRLKYQTKRPLSWILAIIKVIDLEIHLSLTCELTTNRHKHFTTRISLPATHQWSIKASSKAKHLGCFELTLQEKLLKSTLEHSDHAFRRELSRYASK